MLKRLIGLGLVAVLGGVVSVVLHADTINAADCEEASVQTAVDAADPGDTVAIPAGTCTWTTTVTVDKSIEIVGVGGLGTRTQCEVGSQATYTCIKGDIRHLTWDTPSTGTPRLAGITFYGDSCATCGTGGGSPGAYGGGFVNIEGSNGQFRLHDVLISTSGAGYTGLIVADYVRGVGWDNVCDQLSQVDHCWLVIHGTWLDSGNLGNVSWSEPSTIGTVEAWYWEDNTFGITGFSSQGFCTDDFYGSRVVYRFNSLTNCSLQNHGTETGGQIRGHREVDYYRNIAVNDNTAWPGAFAFRGGSGLCWGNTFTTSGSGSYTKTCEGTTFRRDDESVEHEDGFPGGSAVTWYPWNGCGVETVTIASSGTTATVTLASHKVSGSGSYVTISGANESEYNGTFVGTKTGLNTYTYTMLSDPAGSAATGTITAQSPFDGNDEATGWPCLDGFGVGESQEISGDLPNIVFTPDVNPTRQPVYGWLNRLNGSQTDVTASMDFVEANRDLFNENSSYNGTTERGVFVGTSLPANCTTGDAAWITDEGSWNTETTAMHANHGSNHTEGADGKRYECVATDDWDADYGVSATGEPYAYPHPLRSEAEGTPRMRLRFRADIWLPLSFAIVVGLRRRP